MGLKWQMCEKIHVVYICNFVSSIDWQIRFGRDLPVLSEVARRIMCISASSAQSERDFSCVGHTITDTRSRLSAEKIESVELIMDARSAMRPCYILPTFFIFFL